MKEQKPRPYIFTNAVSEELSDAFENLASQIMKDGALSSKEKSIIAHYPRFGFFQAREKGLEVPFTVPDEAFMVIELVPGSLEHITGIVKYPKD